MKVLLTNDDGIEAPGLAALLEAFGPQDEVTVAAPDRPRSACSSSLTLHEPLVVQAVKGRAGCYAISGTPADAVKLAVNQLLEGPPDVVVSGINRGLNTGINILYSGTVAAALEGALMGIPAFAVSIDSRGESRYAAAAEKAVGLIRALLPQCLPGAVLNINFPAGEPRGVRATRQDECFFRDSFDRREDPRGREYFWLKDYPDEGAPPRGAADGPWPSDAQVVEEDFISVTPLHRDMTCARLLDALRKSLDQE